jgi:DnaK suppressor protein
MDRQVAKQRLSDEHVALHDLLLSSAAHGLDDREGANEQGDMSDSEEGLTTQAEDDAVTSGLRVRLAQLHRALDRLDDGTYGRSLRSGQAISDERLDADPAAEFTAQEAVEPTAGA